MEEKLEKVSRLNLELHHDDRGTLVLVGNDVYSQFTRLFCIANTSKSNSTRGNHAHRHSTQIFMCMAGPIKIELFDGKDQYEIELTKFGEAIKVLPMIWSRQFYSPESILMVMCDTPFSDSEYIHSMTEFLALTNP